MKTLPDINTERAIAGGCFPPVYDRPLTLELAFTAAHRRHERSSPVQRELACLEVLFPTILQPIQDGDLIAGRIAYPMVAFSPEPGGLGYACNENAIRAVLESDAEGIPDRASIEEMLDYWRTRTTAVRTRAAYPPHVAAALPSDEWFTESGPAFPLYRLAGTVLDYATLLREGLPGLAAMIAARRAKESAAEKCEFLGGLQAVLSVVARSLQHYAAQSRSLSANCDDGVRAAQLNRIARSCDALVDRAPATLHEAIQLAWIYALMSGTWNYGRVDDWLGPFLARDLDAGRLTDAKATELLCSWWRLMAAYENPYNNRVFIGGRGRTDEAAADRFALFALEATRQVRLNQPQLSLRFYRGQNPALMARALDLLGEGCTFPILYNDEVNIPAVAHAFSLPESEAIHYTPYGCGEYVLAHRSVGTPNGVINLAKCLELALHDGWDPVAGRQAGPHTGTADRFTTFEDLWRAYATQLETLLAALAEQEKIEYEVAGREAPFLLLSALYDDCIDRARPIFAGGVRHLGGTVETYGNTNTADALFAIERVVFADRILALPQLVAQLDADFASADGASLRQRLRAVAKYGNDEDTVDAMARRVHEHVCTQARAQAARVGLDSYLVVTINNWANTVLGRTTAASADGRRTGEPLANANNPSSGADHRGVTAFLNSLVKLDPSLHAGAVQNMKFSRSLFLRNRPKLEALLDAYWTGGGTQAMITVLSRADLESAMQEPEKWGNLMVRVGGFSIRFVDLPRDAQLEILARTLYD